MNSTPSTSSSLFSLLPYSACFNAHRHRHHFFSLLITSSFRRRRLPNRRRRRRDPPFTPQPSSSPSSSSSDRDISLSINLESITDRASSTLRRFLASGADAVDDLRTSVYIDPGRHVVFSCRRSSVLFLMNVVAFGLAVAVVVRAVAFLGFWRRLGFGDGREVVTVRRDRSLGGREVVVGTTRRREIERGGGGGRGSDFRSRVNPLSDMEGIGRRGRGNFGGKWMVKDGEEKKLPEWWPGPVFRRESSDGNEELKREANRLVRGLRY